MSWATRGAVAVVVAAFTLAIPSSANAAITQIPPPGPQPGSYGLAAVKNQAPPPSAATISSPGNGASFSSSPITVSGLCTKDLLVEIFDNGVFVGSVNCATGSFQLKVSLFTAKNVLSAIQYDELGQASPESNKVTVQFSNLHLQAFGELITLTSDYARRAANPGDTLTWPVKLSGGTGPYAFSVDWGDAGEPSLISASLAGNITLNHVYSHSGIYEVTIRVTDKNGVSAFLQVVAVANGKVTTAAGQSGGGGTGTTVITKILWIPALIVLLLLLPAYWLGRHSELVSIHRRLEKDLEEYKEV